MAHCGQSLAGSFIWSLTYTDILSGWTEGGAVWNKGAAGVLAALGKWRSVCALALLGFDSDNGGEFLNHRPCLHGGREKPPWTLLAPRPYHSDDNAHVEQKNWTWARQLLGYGRPAVGGAHQHPLSGGVGAVARLLFALFEASKSGERQPLAQAL